MSKGLVGEHFFHKIAEYGQRRVTALPLPRRAEVHLAIFTADPASGNEVWRNAHIPPVAVVLRSSRFSAEIGVEVVDIVAPESLRGAARLTQSGHKHLLH